MSDNKALAVILERLMLMEEKIDDLRQDLSRVLAAQNDEIGATKKNKKVAIAAWRSVWPNSNPP